MEVKAGLRIAYSNHKSFCYIKNGLALSLQISVSWDYTASGNLRHPGCLKSGLDRISAFYCTGRGKGMLPNVQPSSTAVGLAVFLFDKNNLLASLHLKQILKLFDDCTCGIVISYLG